MRVYDVEKLDSGPLKPYKSPQLDVRVTETNPRIQQLGGILLIWMIPWIQDSLPFVSQSSVDLEG